MSLEGSSTQIEDIVHCAHVSWGLDIEYFPQTSARTVKTFFHDLWPYLEGMATEKIICGNLCGGGGGNTLH